MPEFDMPLGLGTAAIIATDKTRITELAIRATVSASTTIRQFLKHVGL